MIGHTTEHVACRAFSNAKFSE